MNKPAMVQEFWRVIIFILFVMGIPLSAAGYLGWRLIGQAGFSRRYRTIAWISLALCFVLTLGGFTSMRFHDGDWMYFLRQSAFLIGGYLVTIVFLLLILDICRLVLWSLDKLSHLASRRHILPSSKETRKRIVHYCHLGLLGISLALVIFGYFEARREPQIKIVSITLPGLPSEFDGFRIAQLSDVHVDGFRRGTDLNRMVERINSLDADIVAITGDLVEFRAADIRNEISSIAQLKAREGVFYVTGNHEYYVGVDEWADEIRRLGIPVLLNEHRIISRGNSRLLVAGVPNIQSGMHGTPPSQGGIGSIQSDPAASLINAPGVQTKILLAHQSASAVAAQEAGFDLMLCGHTHGGQFFPITLVAYLVHPYLSGLHKSGSLYIFVNNGAGVLGPPLRLGVPPEITVLELHRGE